MEGINNMTVGADALMLEEKTIKLVDIIKEAPVDLRTVLFKVKMEPSTPTTLPSAPPS